MVSTTITHNKENVGESHIKLTNMFLIGEAKTSGVTDTEQERQYIRLAAYLEIEHRATDLYSPLANMQIFQTLKSDLKQ